MSADRDRSAAEPTQPTPPRKAKRNDADPVLPSRSDAEREEAWGDRSRSAERDADWYREQRPPHHGD